MAKRIRQQTLKQFVASYPRTVTQGEIARELGLSDSSLSSYLKGNPPSRETALRLYRDFGISLEDLLESDAGMSVPGLVAVAFCAGVLVGVALSALAIYRQTIPRMSKRELAQEFYRLQTAQKGSPCDD